MLGKPQVVEDLNRIIDSFVYTQTLLYSFFPFSPLSEGKLNEYEKALLDNIPRLISQVSAVICRTGLREEGTG